MSHIHTYHDSTFDLFISFAEDDAYVGKEIAKNNYEPYETALFLEHVESDSIILDVGANIGYYSLIASNNVVPGEGIIHSFEPSSKTYALLEKNITQNERATIIPHKFALSNKIEQGYLYLSPENMGDHRIFSSEDNRLKEEISIITGDSFIEKQKIAPTLIKIDTQGYDYNVLLGLENYLSTDHTVTLFTEFWHHGNLNAGIKSEDYFQFLCTYFHTIQIISEEFQNVTPASFDEIMSLCSKFNNTNHVNLLCSR